MNHTEHRLVASYLDELTRALTELDPADRSEVLSGVREHIDAALAARGSASDADVSAVVTELGTPEEVAREAFSSGQYAERPGATAGSPYPPTQLPPASPAGTRISDRSWVPVAVALLQALGVLFILVVVGSSAVITTMEVQSGAGGDLQGQTREVTYQSAAAAALAGGLLVLPLWLVVALLAGNSTLWGSRQKLLHLLLMPGVLVLSAVLPDLGWAIAGEIGVNIAALAALVISVVGSIWLLVRLTKSARARVALSR